MGEAVCEKCGGDVFLDADDLVKCKECGRGENACECAGVPAKEMTIKNILKKAVEGGWVPHLLLKEKDKFEYVEWVSDDGMSAAFYIWQSGKYPWTGVMRCAEIFCDPSFWQSLGKALGWDKNDELTQSLLKKAGGNEMSVGQYVWCRKWHLFIDHIASGRSPATFFEKHN